MTGFFLPWRERERQEERNTEQRLYLPKGAFSLEDSWFNSSKNPYVSLPNPRGILRSFLEAVEKDRREEALGYLSKSVAAAVDFDEVKKLFAEVREYHCFLQDNNGELSTVSMACGGENGRVISFRMVAEPDQFGKWKIYCIEKE